MRIVIFNWRDIKNPAAGGAEVVTHEVSRRWVAKGHRVTVFGAAYKGAPERECVDGVEVVRGGGRIGVYWAARRWYERDLKGECDVLVDEINTVPFFTPFYASGKIVSLIHQLCREIWFYESALPVALMGYLAEPLYLQAYREIPCITVSESTRRDLIRLGFRREQIYVVPEGINFEPIARGSIQKEADPTVIYVGRLKQSKRVHHVIQAMGLAGQEIPELKLWIVGEGDPAYREKLRALVDRFGIENRVVFWGRVPQEQRNALMSRAHCIAVTSVREGWGLIVTEANAMGTPAVVYDVPGLRDSVRRNVTGLVCEERAPKGLAKVLVDFFSDEALRGCLGEHGLAWSRSFNWDRTAEEVMEVLEGI